MTVAPEERDVVQHMALAFVTTTLYLLVQPRPKNLPKIVKRGDKKVRSRSRISHAHLPFVEQSCSMRNFFSL